MAPRRNQSLIILASASPRRKALMKKHGYRFRVVPSRVSERVSGAPSPSRLVKALAVKKAVSVARRHPENIVLGADTIVFIGKRVIGKPRNPRHAAQILRRLSGAWQQVYTGVSVVWAGGRKKKSGVAVSHVKMRSLSGEEIARASRKHLDKAGGYAVQEKGDAFVERIRGDYDNVVGLPMRLVRKLLRGAG